MEATDLGRIRFTTQHFHELQGFRIWVPLGLITLGWGGPALLRAGSCLAAFLLMLGARRYYKSTFGEVERPVARPAAVISPVSIFSPAGAASCPPAIPLAQRFLMILGLIPAVIVAFQILFWPPWITLDSTLVFTPASGGLASGDLAVLAYFLSGAVFLAVWFHRGHRLSEGYHLALGALLLGVPVLAAVPVVTHPSVALTSCGSAMILAGFLDHRQLVRALGRP
jgi:hypothetical protein